MVVLLTELWKFEVPMSHPRTAVQGTPGTGSEPMGEIAPTSTDLEIIGTFSFLSHTTSFSFFFFFFTGSGGVLGISLRVTHAKHALF
jgi:hypothetical protein